MVSAYELYGKYDEAIDAHQRFFGTPGPTLSLASWSPKFLGPSDALKCYQSSAAPGKQTNGE
jgi:hypothetical protein